MHDWPRPLHESQPARMQVMSAGSYAAPEGKDFPPHKHVTWELAYYREGHIQCPIGDEVYVGQPGVLLATPPGITHAELARTGYVNFWVQIEAPTNAPWPRMCVDDRDQTLGHVCAALVREHQEQSLGYAEMGTLLVNQLDILLRRVQEQRHLSAAERLVRQVEHIVAERHGTPFRVQEIAREVGVSPTYLRAQFVRLRGKSPREHVQAVRARHALALLRNSTLTLEAIAEICGYDSASHLSRHIKRVTGATPGSLRGK